MNRRLVVLIVEPSAVEKSEVPLPDQFAIGRITVDSFTAKKYTIRVAPCLPPLRPLSFPSSRRLKLEWDESVIKFLVNKGYSQKLGARPLQRTIQQEISTRIARILATQPNLSDTSFVLSVIDGALMVEKAQVA